VVAVILGITWSCRHDEESIKPQEESIFLNESEMQGIIKLGKKLENPYSVENMKKAWENLKSSQANGRISGDDLEITITHLYIRFKPKNEDELAILQRDSTLILYTYPLDYEIEQTGDFYHDPEIPVGQPTYQYCAVEVDEKLPEGVEYETLAELFIPDEYSDEDESSPNGRIASSSTVAALVDEALRITGNLEERVSDYSNARRSKWRPAGRIRVWDDSRSNWSGVEGIEVRARRWFTTHEGMTDANGNYSCNGRFKRDANYSIKWERYHYSIRSGSIGQAVMDGPKRTGDWNVDIQDNDIQQFYAFIHLGAHHYYYGNILGLSRPPLNGGLKPQMKIGGFDKDGRANHNDDRRFLGIRNQVKMYRIENGNIAGCERLYNTTLHELAHASHWEFRKGEWDNGNTEDKLQESWAMGVAWSLTRLRYPNHNWWANWTFEDMRTDGENQYTPLIIDLIDNINQGTTNTTRPFDRVTGYTISEIEAVIGASDNIAELRDNLRNQYPNNPTRDFLNELFEQYINLTR